MVQDAERFSQEDEKRRAEVEARNNADSLIYQAEKLMSEQGENVPEEIKSEVEGKIAACRSALQGEDIAHLQSTARLRPRAKTRGRRLTTMKTWSRANSAKHR